MYQRSPALKKGLQRLKNPKVLREGCLEILSVMREQELWQERERPKGRTPMIVRFLREELQERIRALREF